MASSDSQEECLPATLPYSQEEPYSDQEPTQELVAIEEEPVEPAAAEPEAAAPAYLVHCLHCKQKTLVKESEQCETVTGRKMLRGQCSVCSSRVTRFI